MLFFVAFPNEGVLGFMAGSCFALLAATIEQIVVAVIKQ